MTLRVIGAGLGRTGTMSLKIALEHLGLGPCYHMTEVFAAARRNIPLWTDAVHGRPDWDAIFEGFTSTTDYPAAAFWQEITAHYPEARVILPTRDPASWFRSVHTTIMSPEGRARFEGTPAREMMARIYAPFGNGIDDEASMVAAFMKHEKEVTESIAPERLFLFRSSDGWEPLCAFLGVAVPSEPYPRVNTTEDMQAVHAAMQDMERTGEPLEEFGKTFIGYMKGRAFAPE